MAARAFAAALQCVHDTGCGTCPGCHTTLAGTHADVRSVVPQGLSIGVDEMRALVLRAASTPSGGRWQVVVIEDADRLTEAAGNALLKAVEEPAPRTVFLLCAPSTHPDDVSVTRSMPCDGDNEALLLADLLDRHGHDAIYERALARAATLLAGTSPDA